MYLGCCRKFSSKHWEVWRVTPVEIIAHPWKHPQDPSCCHWLASMEETQAVTVTAGLPPWALHPAAASWGIPLGNLMGHFSYCALGLPLHLGPGLWCSPMLCCGCVCAWPVISPDHNKIQKADLKKWVLMCYWWWNIKFMHSDKDLI